MWSMPFCSQLSTSSQRQQCRDRRAGKNCGPILILGCATRTFKPAAVTSLLEPASRTGRFDASLQMALERKVFGQHLATQVVLKALSSHARDKQPRKPLVMSFHGWTGTGKSFISRIIAQNLYQHHQARRSFVHQFNAVLHFPHADHIQQYKEQLQNWIRGNVSACPRSLFIFSEMEQMPYGLIDSIIPYLGHREAVNGIYYGKAIFLFLNNAGGDNITEVTLDHWRKQKEREEIPLRDLQSMLSAEIFNNRNSGFWNSKLIQKNLVDYFIPFLPLEYKHVKECIREELRYQGHQEDEDLIIKIALEMSDYPNDDRIYSSKGCKTVTSKVNLNT
ncbi:torsin-1A-like isoform X3 [Pelodiscus sinensis]|uniref:torsin-1A-like isoform X3 n=1 Tax=Pelodiscus sinensis TaxID=13735 RepID=UPI003F6BFBA1